MYPELEELPAISDGHEDDKTGLNDVVCNNSNEFQTDSTVPPGWSYRGELAEGKHFQLRSPNGQTYPSRATAIPRMILSGSYSLEEISKMKQCLQYEGWKDREDIPDGWKIKRRPNKRGYYFLEQGGKRLRSAKQALVFVLKYRKYYVESDIEKLSHFARKRSSKSKRNISDCSNDVSVSNITSSPFPELNSKIRMEEDLKLTVSDFSQQNIQQESHTDQMHNSQPVSPRQPADLSEQPEVICLSTEPEPINDQQQVSQQVYLQQKQEYFNPQGYLSQQHIIPQPFYAQSGFNTIQHYNNIQPIIVQNQSNPSFLYSKAQLAAQPVPILPKEELHLNKQEEPKKIRISRDWKTDDSIYPQGWSYSEGFTNGKKTFDRVKSDSGVNFLTKRAALAFLISNNYPAGDIEKLHRSIELDGWKVSPSLPPLWRYRRRPGKGCEFSSPDGKHFKSREAVVKMLQEMPDGPLIYSAEIELIRNFIAI